MPFIKDVKPLIQKPLFPDKPTEKDIKYAVECIPGYVQFYIGVRHLARSHHNGALEGNYFDQVWQDVFQQLIEDVMGILHPDITDQYEIEEGFYDEDIIDRFMNLYEV